MFIKRMASIHLHGNERGVPGESLEWFLEIGVFDKLKRAKLFQLSRQIGGTIGCLNNKVPNFVAANRHPISLGEMEVRLPLGQGEQSRVVSVFCILENHLSEWWRHIQV